MLVSWDGCVHEMTNFKFLLDLTSNCTVRLATQKYGIHHYPLKLQIDQKSKLNPGMKVDAQNVEEKFLR